MDVLRLGATDSGVGLSRSERGPSSPHEEEGSEEYVEDTSIIRSVRTQWVQGLFRAGVLLPTTGRTFSPSYAENTKYSRGARGDGLPPSPQGGRFLEDGFDARLQRAREHREQARRLHRDRTPVPNPLQ